MKKLKSQKGAITMIVLITIVFMISFLMTSYILITNKVRTQKEMLAETKAIYEPKTSMEELYNSYFANGNIIPIYTVEQLLKIGRDESITINGKVYTFSYSANYLLMNDLEFSAIELGLASDWVPPYRNTDFIGNFEWSGHVIKVTNLSGTTIIYDGKYSVTKNNTENLVVLTDAVKSNLVNYKIEGNSVQKTTKEGNNICPPITDSRWVLENGAYINENNYIVFPNENSKAYIDIDWNKRGSKFFIKAFIPTGGTYHISTQYFDENKVSLGSNGAAATDKGDGITANAEFGSASPYSEYISNAETIRVTFLRSSYAPSEFSVTDIMISETDVAYEEYVPNSPSPNYPSEIKSVGDETVNLFDITNYTIINSCLAFDTSNLIEGEQYTFTSNKPIGWFKISNSSSGYNSITKDDFVNKFTSFTFTMTRNENISKTATQYIFMGIGESSKDGFVTDISQLDGYNIQIQKGSTATEYEPYGKYKIPISVEGKNLFNINNPKLNKEYNVKTETIDNGFKYTSTTNGAWNSYSSYTLDFNKISGKTITLSADFKVSEGNKGMLRIGYWTNSSFLTPGNTYVEVSENGKYEVTATIPDEMPENAKEYAIFFNTSRLENMSGATLEVRNIQVEINDKATAYESYNGENYNIYLDEPLRKVGDYADYIDFQKQAVIRKVKYREFTSSDTWTKYVSINNHFQVAVGDNLFSKEINPVLCNYYNNKKTGKTYYSAENYSVLTVDGSRIRFKNKDCSTVEEWIEHLNSLSNTLYVIYALATEDSPQPIDLPNIQLYKGTNTITVGTEIAPSNMTITYNAKQ